MEKNTIHLKAPGNWINDPNGFIYYQGKYHLFYQYFPYAARWGTMHWGHAVSEDLAHWEHVGVALFPTKYGDQNGCFSGSAVEQDGRMYLFYTGVRYIEVDPENIHHSVEGQFEACQMMLMSEDGVCFDNFGNKKMIIPPIGDEEIGDRTHTRDPKVWRGRDAWYMVLGSRTKDQNGRLLFYRSDDLTEWTFVNGTGKREGFGWMLECPDFFAVDGSQVLVVSPMGIMKDGKKNPDHAVCMLVEFEEKTCTMKFAQQYQFMDYGLDLYAPQSTADAQGRRVMVAWLRMPEPVEGRWIGMFCIPRVVEVKDGHIYFRPHPDVAKMFSRRIGSAAEADDAGYRVSLELKEGETLDIGGYKICRRENRICTDRTAVFGDHTDWRLTASTPEIKEGLRLDIYVDRNLIEIYVNDGEYVLSSAVYGLGEEILADCEGGLLITTLQ